MVVRRRTDVDLDALAQVVARVRAADDYPTYLPGDDYHRFLTRPEPLEAYRTRPVEEYPASFRRQVRERLIC